MGDSRETARLVWLRVAEIRAQRKRRRRILGASVLALFLCAALAATAALWQPPRPVAVELEESPMPMAALRLGVDAAILSVNLDRLELAPGQTEVALRLESPESSPCPLTFAIILKDTGEALYTSAPLAPSASVDGILLSRGLDEGEYEASLLVRAYDPDTKQPLEESHFDFDIIVR